MSSVWRFWAKRPHVSTVSRISGVVLLVLAVSGQVVLGYYVITDLAGGLQSRSEVVAEASNETGLSSALVELYADSVVAEDGTVLFAPVGEEIQVPFPPADNAITWGGSSPTLVLEVGGDEFAIKGASDTGLELEAPSDGSVPEVPVEPSSAHDKLVEAVIAVRPVDWGDTLPPAYDNDPYMTVAITDASDDALHSRLPAQASFDLVFAKKNSDNSATFANVTRRAYANTKEFDLVIASSEEAKSLEVWRDRLSDSGRSALDRLGLAVFVELIALGLLAFAFGVYRGGLD